MLSLDNRTVIVYINCKLTLNGVEMDESTKEINRSVFSVVLKQAREAKNLSIRKLAEQSRASTEEISKILISVKDGVLSANDATNKVVNIIKDVDVESENVVSQFKLILAKVEEMNMKVHELSSAAEEQSASTEEMAAAMDRISRVITEISDQVKYMVSAIDQQTQSSHQVNESAEEGNKLAQSLMELINKFNI